ncbi:MAG: F0F1 ATP synthase subunit A [Candidatus Zixiibacteriota bacterium]
MIQYTLLNKLLITTQEAAGHAAEAAEHGGGHGEEQGLSMHIPSLLTFTDKVMHTHYAHTFAVTFFGLLIALMLMFAAMMVYRKRQLIPGPFQNVVEMIFEGLYNMVHAMLGKETDRYIPFLGTLFIYIWCMNMSGLVPGFHAPTSSIKMTIALAATVFLYVQYTAVTRLGIKKYLLHLCGDPSSGVTWGLAILNFPLHVFGEFIKPVSLAARLFGNIFGEDTLIAVMISLGVVFMSIFWHNNLVGIPFQLPFYFLSLLLGTIQALVFMMLSTSYIMMALPHSEH